MNKLKEYWLLLRQYGKFWHYLVLCVAVLFLWSSGADVIISAIELDTLSLMVSVMWVLLIITIVGLVFRSLKKRAVKDINNNQVFSKNQSPAIEQQPRNFWNYFPLVLFIINTVAAIMVYISFHASAEGFGAIVFFVWLFLIFCSVPAVIMPLLGRFKTISNIFAIIFLMPGLLFILFVLSAPTWNSHVAKQTSAKIQSLNNKIYVPVDVKRGQIDIGGNNLIRLDGIASLPSEQVDEFEKVFREKVINAHIPITTILSPDAYTVYFTAGKAEKNMASLKQGEKYFMVVGNIMVNGEVVDTNWLDKNK